VGAEIDAVVTHHTDGFRSGVARFNEMLAEHLGVPLRSLAEGLGGATHPLFSFKASELDPAETTVLAEVLGSHAGSWEVFLHEYAGLGIEASLVRSARRVHCGNLEILRAVAPLNRDIREAWTPGLIVDDRPLPSTELSVFSFGMAHKIRAEMFARLKALLDASDRSYTVYVSAANHETASLRDARIVFDEMQSVFQETLFFLGNLSDVAIAHWLRETTYFAAFFNSGVRANNTSVAAAMERGAVVITNLDHLSPVQYVHGRNMLDIEELDRLPVDAATLGAVGAEARRAAAERGWSELVTRLTA
jgi:hypothetical protein